MSGELSGKRVAVLVDNYYQELEVWYPLLRMREAGAEVFTVGPEAGATYKSKLGYPVKADRAIADVDDLPAFCRAMISAIESASVSSENSIGISSMPKPRRGARFQRAVSPLLATSLLRQWAGRNKFSSRYYESADS